MLCLTVLDTIMVIDNKVKALAKNTMDKLFFPMTWRYLRT
jgi:hypothetical protein